MFEIIRSTNTLPHDADEDIEVPLDELDTLTLRKLQKFVEVYIMQYANKNISYSNSTIYFLDRNAMLRNENAMVFNLRLTLLKK